MRSDKVRRAFLLLPALMFLAIAAGSAVAPHVMAAGLGYRLESIDALSEFRAVYVGVWSATAALLLIAAWRISHALLGDLGAIFILGQTGGRVLSLVVDGLPSGRVWPLLLLEALGGLAILAVRPDRPEPPPGQAPIAGA
ncbi:MAG: DUF4345 family protein [Myxococcota bacterium]